MPSFGFSVVIIALDKTAGAIDAVNRRLAAIRAPAERVQKSLAKFGQLSGISEVAKGLNKIGNTAVNAASSIIRVIEPLAAITSAASIAGVLRLTQAWASFGAQLGFNAQRIGISATQLQSLQGGAELAGASASSLTSGLMTLGQSMYDAIGGRAPQTVALMNQLGIAFDDGTRHARKVTDVLPEIADKIAALKDPYSQARVAAQLFGGAAEDLLPFLRMGSKGIEEYTAKARAYGVMNKAGTDAANKLRMAQAGVTLSVQGLTNSIAEKLAPVIEPLLNQLAQWISVNREFISTRIGEYVNQFATWVKGLDLSKLIDDVKGFAVEANNVAQSLGGWKTVLEGVVAIKLAAWAAGAVKPLLSILRLLALVPGSGVALAAAAAGTSLSGEGIGGRGNAQTGFRAPRPGGAAVTDEKANAPTWLDRNIYAPMDKVLQKLGIEGGNETIPDAGIADPRARALSYFTNNGWTPEQAAGIVANIQSESGFKPSAVGDSGNAYGLGQWHKDRQANFAKFAGHLIQGSTLDEQLRFYNYELQNGDEQSAGKRLRGAKTAYEAGDIVSRYDERPAAADEAASNRGALASQIYAMRPSVPSAPGATGADGKVHVATTIKVTSEGKVSAASSKATGSGSATASPPKVDSAMAFVG